MGNPATAIARLAEERGADLVVVGTRELGALQRLLGQSVSQACCGGCGAICSSSTLVTEGGACDDHGL
jgi:hypothetical protein